MKLPAWQKREIIQKLIRNNQVYSHLYLNILSSLSPLGLGVGRVNNYPNLNSAHYQYLRQGGVGGMCTGAVCNEHIFLIPCMDSENMFD